MSDLQYCVVDYLQQQQQQQLIWRVEIKRQPLSSERRDSIKSFKLK